jgi:hypothetical protein
MLKRISDANVSYLLDICGHYDDPACHFQAERVAGQLHIQVGIATVPLAPTRNCSERLI